MFQVNQNLLDKYDSATSDGERVRISCAFFRNHINNNQDELLEVAMEEAFEWCSAKTNDENVKAVQEDLESYLSRCRWENDKCHRILPSLQVVRADTFRLKKMLEGNH